MAKSCYLFLQKKKHHYRSHTTLHSWYGIPFSYIKFLERNKEVSIKNYRVQKWHLCMTFAFDFIAWLVTLTAHSRGVQLLMNFDTVLKRTICLLTTLIEMFLFYMDFPGISLGFFPVDTRRRFNVYKTSIRLRGRRIDVL